MAAVGSTMNSVVSATVVAMVSANIVMAQSTELLWGFINTLQILYFFPVLNLKFPDHLSSILSNFASAKLQFPIPYISTIRQDNSLNNKVDMPTLNEKWDSVGYKSTSILINGLDIFSLLVQGALT